MTAETKPFDYRKRCVQLILEQMRVDDRIWVVTGDLGYKVWDGVRQEFPDRFLNTGAAEQALMGIGVGLALSGKVPLVYSISPFVLYRAFETVRNYLHHEKVPVKLLGSGRDRDYATEGFSHWAEEDRKILHVLDGITGLWPNTPAELDAAVAELFHNPLPYYLSLKRAG